MADLLINLLEIAEREMPEGDYVRVARLLRDVHQRPEPVTETRFRVEHPIKVMFSKRGVPNYIQIVRQERIARSNGRHTYTTEYRINGDPRTHVSFTSFNRVVRDFLHLHTPKLVMIESHIGKAHITYRQRMKTSMDYYKVLSERLQMEHLSDEIRESLEEARTDAITFTYSDFVDYVLARIPDFEEPVE